MSAGLTCEEQRIVEAARSAGLLADCQSIAYAPERLCLVLSLALVPLTLGISLILCPCLWALQHERTGARLRRLRRDLAGRRSRERPGLALGSTVPG